MNRACGAVKSNFKKVTHVIFDLDGLLLDSERIYKSVINHIAKKYGSEYTSGVLKKVLGTTQRDTCKIAVREMNLPISPEKFHEFFNHETKIRLANVGLMPGAEKFVRHLHERNVPIAVATSSSKEGYDLKTRNHGEFFSLFHHKVTGGSDPEVLSGKPSPDVFLVCASRFPNAPKPSDCLVLEDAPNGVQAAKRAGMQCIMIPDPAIVTPEFQKGATLVLNSLEELQPELFGLPEY